MQRGIGRGTFVAPAKIHRGLGAVAAYPGDAARGLRPSSRLLQFGIQAPPRHIAQQLGAGEGAPLLYVEQAYAWPTMNRSP